MANDMSPQTAEEIGNKPTIEELLNYPETGEQKPTVEELLNYEPTDETRPSVEELLAYEPESDLGGQVEAIKIAKPEHVETLQKDLMAAEAKRRETLDKILNNERILGEAKKLKASGASDEDIESFKKAQGWTEPSLFGALWDSVKRLAQTESSFPLDVKVALEGRSEALSPLKLLETVVTNPLSPSKWEKTDTNVTERTKALLSKPIIDKFGKIDPEAVAIADLPRYQQNELMLEYAQRQTGIPKEVWSNILTTRGGVLAADDTMAAAKRVMRSVDEVVFNTISRKMVQGKPSEKLEVLKTKEPPIPIEITWDGDKAYANGVYIPDAHKGDTPQELEREGWSAIIDQQKGVIESQAMENWQAIPGMLIPWGGAIKAAGKTLGIGAKAASLAGKTAKVLEAAGKPGEVLVGAGKTVARAAPTIVEKVANLEKTSPIMAKAIKLSGEALMKTAVPGAIAAYGAPEQQGEAAFTATVLLSGLGFAAEKGLGKIYSAKDPMKAVLRNENYDTLPSYVKKFVDNSIMPGQTYGEFRTQTMDFLQAMDEFKGNVAKIESGQVPAETATIMVDELARDPRAIKVFDQVSMGGDPNGLTPQGRLNKADIDRLITEQKQRGAEKKAQAKGQTTDEASQFLDVQDKLANTLVENLKQIPNKIFNDTDKLISLLKGEEVDGYKVAKATFIAEAMENVLSTRGDNFAYKLMAQDLMKTMAATAQASTPAQFASYMKFISNPPEFANQISAASKASQTAKTEIFGTEVEKINTKLSTSNLLEKESPGAELKDVIRMAVDTNMFYREKIADKSGRPLIANDLRVAKLERQEALRRYRIQSSIDLEHLDREVNNLSRAEEAAERDLRQGRVTTVKTSGPEGTKKIEIPGRVAKLISYLQDPRMPDPLKRQLIGIVDKLNKGGTIDDIDVSFFPKIIQRDIRSAGYLARQVQELRASRQEALIRASQIDAKSVEARAAKLSQEVLYRNPKKAGKIQEAEIRSQLGEFKGVTDSVYFNNVIAAISKDVGNSLESGGAVNVSNKHLGYFALLQNNKFVEKVLGVNTWGNKEWSRFKTKLRGVSDTLYAMSAEGERWNDSVRLLNESLSSHKVNVEGMARHLKHMRAAFQISKMQRELDKYAYRIYDIAGRLEDGGVMSVKDRKNLAAFMGSTVMQRYRLARDPSWIVTRGVEAETVFKTLKNANVEVLGYMKEYMRDILGKDSNDLNATIATSWFINPTNDYDKSGYLSGALKLAEYYGKGKGASPLIKGFGGSGGSVLTWAGSEEYISTVISKGTAISVANDVSEMAAGRAVGKAAADELVMQFFKDVEKLKVGNKSYIDFQTAEPFVEMLKKNVVGLKRIEGRLMQDGVETELGSLFRKWVNAGQTSDSLNRIIEEWKGGVKSREVEAKANSMKDSLLTYWAVKGLTPEMHQMGTEWIKLWQQYDRKKLDLWNKHNADLNRRHGTNVAPLEYQPARLETDASISSNVKFDNTNFDKLSSMDVLFGRSIATSERGQNLKAQFNIDIKDIMHPQELFMEATQKFFQDLHTREPRRRLWEKGLLMQNAGYQYYANAVAQSLMGSLSVNSPDTARMIRDAFNKVLGLKQLKALSPLVNPNWLLVSLGQIVQNTVQNVQVMALNPFNSKRAAAALLKSGPGFVGGVYDRIFGKHVNTANLTDVLESASLLTKVPSPEYALRNVELVRALNPQIEARYQSQIARINWEASPMWKRFHKKTSGFTDAVFEGVAGVTKENAEALTYRIVLGQAANLWDGAVQAAMGAQKAGRGAMYRAAKGVVEGALSGVTGSRVDIADMAMGIVKGIEDGKPMAGYDRFAVNFAHQMVSRYDPKNVPVMVRNLGRVVPGTSQFFNPLSIGLYRLFAAGHSLVSAQGRNAAHVGVALATVGALVGFASLWQSLSDQSGISSFSKLNPIAGYQTIMGEDKQAEFKNLLTAPSIKGGTMGDRLTAELFFEASNFVRTLVQSTEDGTTDTKAMNDSHQKSLNRMVDLLLQTGPVPLFGVLRDIIYSPAKVGWTYIWGDDAQLFDELIQMDKNDELELTKVPRNIVGATDEEVPAARHAFNLLRAMIPLIERKDLADFTEEDVLAYLAKEKAIPLQFLYQLREERKKDYQEKEDLTQTILTGKGSGKYQTDPAEKYREEGRQEIQQQQKEEEGK